MLSRIEDTLDHLGYTKALLLAFVVGFVVRLIPELVSFPYPIGWDTIYYAARIKEGVAFGYGPDIFSSWLPYGIMIFLGKVSKLDPFMVLKIVAPLLYGGCTAGVFFVASKKLDWCVTKSLLASSFFALQGPMKIGLCPGYFSLTILAVAIIGESAANPRYFFK